MSRVTRTFTNRIILAGTLALVAFLLPERGTAQGSMDTFKGEFFGYLDLAAPVGDFGDHVALGGGAGGGVVAFLGENRLAGLRLEGSFIIYGSETERVPFSSTVPFVELDMQTTNSIMAAGLGPQVYLGHGPIRPFIYGTVGFAYFVTSTSVSPAYEGEAIASTTNFDDFRLSLTGGGGLSVEVRGGQNPISLDLTAAYQHNGLTEYLVNGSENLTRRRGGGWLVDPIYSDANLMTYRIGASVGLG